MNTIEPDGQALVMQGAAGAAREIRVGDGDRAAADRVLGEHVTAGRLTSTEYAERAAQAQAARVRSDITALFGDLPAPHPRFDDPAIEPQQVAQPATAAPLHSSTRSPQQYRRLRHAAVAVIVPCALAGAGAGLFFAVEFPVVFLLALVVVAGIYGALVLNDRYFPGGR